MSKMTSAEMFELNATEIDYVSGAVSAETVGAAIGGFIGGVLGIEGGPVGSLAGAALGSIVGGAIGAGDFNGVQPGNTGTTGVVW